MKQKVTLRPIFVVLKRNVGYKIYCDTFKVGLECVLIQQQKGGGIWFMVIEVRRKELSSPWFEISDDSVCT